MFEKFTDRARRVVVLAQEESRLLQHNFIGTEHLLLGLIREEEGVAARVLSSMNISLEGVRLNVEEMIGRGEGTPSGHIPFTPRAKKVLELSLREALRLGHDYIGTEHVLLGLVREGEGVGAIVLQRFGADMDRTRAAVLSVLNGAEEVPSLSEEDRERLAQIAVETAARRHGLNQDDLKRVLEMLDLPPARAFDAVDAIAGVASSFGVDAVELARFVKDHRTTE